MTRVKIQAVEDANNTTDAAVFVRYSTHPDGGLYTASSAFGGGGGGGSVTFSAGTSSAALGSAVFSNSNNVSFGLNGSTITGSVLPPGGVSAGTASAQLGTVVFSNSNGVSFGLNGSTVTASVATALTSQSNQAVSAANGSFTFQTLSMADSNGVSFSTGTQGLYASHNGLTSQSNQAASASNGSFTFQTLNFSNANNVTFGTSAGGVVTASVAAPGGGGGALTLYAVGNTSGASSATATANSLVIRGENYATVGVSDGSLRVYVDHQWFSAGTGQWDPYTLYFSNANGVSFGLGAGASQSILTASVAGGGGSLNVSAGTTSNNLTNVVFSNANGVSFGLNGSTVTASVNAGGGATMSVYALGATNTEHKLSFQNSNGITFGLGGAGSSNLTASHNGLTSQSNQVASASAGSFTFQTLNFSNANNVTFGTSAGGIITASVAAPGGGAGATVSQWPPVPWDVATSTVVLGTTGGTGGSSQITASIYFTPLVLPVAIYYNHVDLIASMVTSAGTGSVTEAYQIGVYTKNGDTLSRSVSYLGGAMISQNSISNFSGFFWYGTATAGASSLPTDSWGLTYNNATNTSRSQFMTGLRDLIVLDKATATLTAGQYWIGVCFSRRSSSVNVWRMGNLAVLSQSQQTAGAVVYGSTVSHPPYAMANIQGIVSTSTNIANTLVTAALLPSSVATANLNTTNWIWPAVKFHAGNP